MINQKRAVIIGKTVFLRTPMKSDASEFIALNRASLSLHRGLVSPPIRPEQFTTFLKRCRRVDSVCLLICRVQDGAIIGSVTLSQIFLGGCRNIKKGNYVGD